MPTQKSISLQTPTPLTRLSSAQFSTLNIKVWIKRDDLNHPKIQGNKWHKLKYNLAHAQQKRLTPIITFGGAYSNHIAATAAAGKEFNLQTLGIIRGNELANHPQKWSHTLKTAAQNGMTLEFVSREDYRLKETAPNIQALLKQHPNAYLIPEGGTNELAIQGLKTLAQEIQQQCPEWTHILLPVGTGGTLAGLTRYINPKSHQKILGIPTAKHYEYLTQNIQHAITKHTKSTPQKTPQAWAFLPPNFPQRYGKITPEIQHIIQQYQHDFNLPLDPIYTARMMLEFNTALQKGFFPKNAKIILIHTGGLQGANQNVTTHRPRNGSNCP